MNVYTYVYTYTIKCCIIDVMNNNSYICIHNITLHNIHTYHPTKYIHQIFKHTSTTYQTYTNYIYKYFFIYTHPHT